MNIAWMVFAIAAAFCTGWSVLGILWPVEPRAQDRALHSIRVFLALGLGQAIAAVHYLLWRATCADVGLGFKLADCVFIPVLAWFVAWMFRKRYRHSDTSAPPRNEATPLSPEPRHIVTVVFVAITAVVVSAALCVCLARACYTPLGEWDGWAIWNLKARFMYRAGADWTGMFSRHIWFSHPDYPLLIPASVARLWTHLGFEATVVPQFISMAFTAMVVGLLFASLAWLRGLVHACVAVILLVIFEPFLTFGGAQMSDIPLSFYVLAAVVIIALASRIGHIRGRLLLLAGVFIGCALITKNEAQPITVSLLIAMLLAARFGGSSSGDSVLAGPVSKASHDSERPAGTLALLRSGGGCGGLVRTRPALLLLGALPFVLVLGVQKVFFAGASYLVADQPSSQAFLQKIVDLGRHKTIIEFVVTWNFAQPSFLMLLALPLVCGVRAELRDRRAALTGIVTVVLTLVIYYAVFLVMPYDLRNLLESFPRVQLHFWPSLIFTVLLTTPIPWASVSQTPRLDPQISTCSRGQ